jgi:predicted transporter
MIVSRVNVIAHYGTFLPLLRGGVAAHWIAALFIFIWGLYLFSSFRLNGPLLGTVGCNGGSSGSRAWFALVIPCPVCLCAVLMSASCLAIYFPEDAAVSVARLYALFILTAGAACVVSLRAKPRDACRERSLGTAMMMISAYFIVSALVMPSFAEAGKVYRIAAYSAETKAGGHSGLYAWGVIALLLLAGYCRGAYAAARRGKR